MIEDRYRIKHIIGEGASGTVYRAIDNTNGREVAIKVHSSSREGFDHECQILKELEHEHIVRLYGQERSSCMLVFELCDYNLISFMNEHELDMRCIKRIVRMVLLALRHMHGRGIIHRDIKLGNILVRGDSVKLCDFGLSCLKAQNDLSYCGTKDYLAPEMDRKMAYDEKIDVFATGIVCKTLITRRKGMDLDIDKVDADVTDLLRNMLDPDPKKRFSSEQALGHRAFDSIYPDVPDFRTVRSFSKSTKHGMIDRDQDYVQIEYQADGRHVMRIEVVGSTTCGIDSVDGGSSSRICCFSGSERKIWKQENCSGTPYSTVRSPSRCEDSETHYKELGRPVQSTRCRCMVNPSYQMSINGKHVSERFLTETELKHYVFLCSYFRIIAERTVKMVVRENGHVFTVTANNSKVLEHRDYRLMKSSRGLWHFSRGKLPVGHVQEFSGQIPHEIRAIFDYFESKALSAPHKCFFQQEGLESCSSMSLPALNDPLIKEYEFSRDVGWCVKNRLRFTILLNDGTRFDLYADEQVMVTCDHKRVRIGREMPKCYKDLLRMSRIFLQKFA